jgi:hypothetical protein
VITFFSSTPLIVAIAVSSVALAAGGIVLDPDALTLGFGLPAAASAIALGGYGIAFTKAHEGRGDAGSSRGGLDEDDCGLNRR